MNLAAILDDCLQRIQAGETIAGCLARYPDQAADLAPMLAVAAQLARLTGQQPSADQRSRTMARLRQEAASQRARQRSRGESGWLAPLAGVRRLAVVAVVAILLLAAVSAGVVASSRPGQAAYELRVIVERAPALVSFDPAVRTAAELSLADRRLDDLQSYLARAGQVQPAALRAMLASDRAAARHALQAGQLQRVQVAERLARRARLLAELADVAVDPTAARALAAAARETRLLAERLRAGPAGEAPLPGQPAGGAPDAQTATPAPVHTPTPSATPSATATATPTATATATVTPSRPPQPAPSAAGWAATPTASATAAAPAEPDQTPGSLLAPRPRPRLTALALTATALAQTPPPYQTPRPRLTALAQTATAMAQTPRPRLTALAQTATAQAETSSPTPTLTSDPANSQPTTTATEAPTATPSPQKPRPPAPQPNPTRPTARPGAP